MTGSVRRWPRWRRIAWLVIAVSALAQAAGEDERFMPKGGRTLLIESLGPTPSLDEFRRIASTKNSDEQWKTFVAARPLPATEREKATLAAYLSVNMPLPAARLTGLKADALANALPRDGRELAWEQCQFCHSLFASHLTQSRDAQGWRNMFMSPFHRELKMTPAEREEFSRYSAINMPMKVEDVPAELRF